MDVGTLKPITRKEMFLSQISGGGNGGGSGADLLNADGVIKQEVLPEGYPYESVKTGYILPETTVTIDPETANGTILGEFEIVDGYLYTVNWNGTDYPCTALAIIGDTTVIMLGNVGLATGGESTGEPFLLGYIPGQMITVAALDGSTSAVLSITGKIVKTTQIDEEYLPNGLQQLHIVCEGTHTPFDVTSVDHNYEDIKKASSKGKQISLTLNYSDYSAPTFENFYFLGMNQRDFKFGCFDEIYIRVIVFNSDGTIETSERAC